MPRIPLSPHGECPHYTHPAQFKWLEPDVTARLERGYRKVKTVLEYCTLNLKYPYNARTMYVAKILENIVTHAYCQHDA